jgi:amino acid transporter
MKKSSSSRGLTAFTLAMLISGSVDNIRNLPASALFGETLIFFSIFSAIVFLIPTALVSAELSSSWTDENGGIYGWVKSAFGEKWGLLTVWLQWINTMVWFPTILSFIAGTVAYLFDPQLAQNKYYLVSVILSTFWILTFINLKGINTSARFASFCAVIGMVLPMALIIILAIIWLCLGKPIQLHFTAATLLPDLHHTQNWISLTAIMTAFLGMELATVHVQHVYHPQRTFPKALLFSVILILFTMTFGALAIALVLPNKDINLVAGVMEAFSNFFNAYHLGKLVIIMPVILVLGSLGGMMNWIISPAKGLLQSGREGYLPKFLTQENQHGAAPAMLFTQAILVTLICLAFLLMPSVSGSYWLLSDLSTQLYMIMYVLMFIAAIVLRYKYSHVPRPFKIPGKGNIGMWITGVVGLLGCIITLIVGFFPPDGIDVGGVAHYEKTFSFGMLVLIAPVFLLFLYKKITQTVTAKMVSEKS